MKDSASSLLRGSALGALIAAAALAAPVLAYAQPANQNQNQQQQSEDNQTTVDELTIVGSRIRRDNFETTAPIQIVNREESTLAGLASTSETLQSNAVTAGGANINNAFGGFVTNGGPGANTLGLRGLGATRTLILLNGRRVAPAGTRGGVGSADLNVLPTAMVERYEILKDGASSIYGSDAVAGVVNIITRRGIDELTLEATGRLTQDGGGESYQVSVVYGQTHDNWELSGSFEYYDRQELAQGDRDWLSCQVDNRFNAVTGARLDFIDPATGQPKCWGITGTNSNGVTINTLGTPTLSGIGAPGSVAPGTTSNFNRWRPNSAINSGLVGFEGVGGGANNINVRDTFEPRMLNRSLISPTQNYNVFLQGSVDLGGAEVYGEALYSRRESQQTNYRQLSIDYPCVSNGVGVGTTAERCASYGPLIPTSLANTLIAGGSVPFLPSGGTLLYPGPTAVRLFIGFGNDHSNQEVDYAKGTIGVRGDIPFLSDWRYDAYYSYARATGDYTFQSFITSRLGQSMQGCPVGSGAGCVVAPAITAAVIGGNLPQNFVDWMFRPVTGTTEYSEWIAAVGFDGPLFRLPDGAVQAAIGFEYRNAEIDDTPPIESQNGDLLNLTSAVPTRGDDNVWEAYGELEIPIFANRRFAREMTLNLSGRYTNYDSYGSGTTYRVGFIYSPNSWLTGRISYGTSYRAPALFEQFQGASTGFLGQALDPCNQYGINVGPGTQRFINCTAEINNPAFQQNQGITVITAGGAAQGLEAETSTNLNYGFILQPHLPSWAGSVAFSVDYYRIEVDNGVQRVGSALLALCYDDPLFRQPGTYCDYVQREPIAQGGRLTLFDSYTNVSTEVTAGYDFNLRYVRDIGDGTLRLNGIITHYVKQSSQLLPTSVPFDFNGQLSTPDFTGALDATYTLRRWKFRYGLDWVGAMNSYPRFFGPFATFESTGVILETPNYYLHHLSVQYRADTWQVTAGVRNVADEEPPIVSCCSNFNRVGNTTLYSGWDYVGRTFFLNVSKTF